MYEVRWSLALHRPSQKDNLNLAAVERYRSIANGKDVVNAALSSLVRSSSGEIHQVHHTVKGLVVARSLTWTIRI